jgi:alpha-methylacyl-CoA racemase
VVDAAMTDGSALLGAMMYGLRAFGSWNDEREANMLDGGAPFYDTYACSDGKFLSVGAIEPQFYAELLELTGALDPELQKQWSQKRWPELKAKFAALFATRTRDEWCDLLEGTDACVAPVLDMAEAPLHPHNRARGAFVEIDGVTQPAPAPRFSRSAPETGQGPAAPGAHSAAVLADWGWSVEAIEALQSGGVI